MRSPFSRGKPTNDAPRRRSESGKNDTRQSRASSDELMRSQYAFRRNRTLTGSSSADISSSNELNAELRSPRAHAHHLLSLRRRLSLYFAGVVVLAAGLYVLLNQLTASTVIQIADVPASNIDQASYEASFESYFAARPVERIRLLLNTSALLSHLQATHPEIKAVELEAGSRLGESVALVQARDAIARWSISGKSSFVDADGVVFEKDYGATPAIRIVDNSGIRVTNDGTVASNRFLGFVGRIIAEAEERGLAINKVTIPALTTRQVQANVAGQKTSYILSIDRLAGEQAEDMQRINRFLNRRNLTPRYVDVRLEGRAFYR